MCRWKVHSLRVSGAGRNNYTSQYFCASNLAFVCERAIYFFSINNITNFVPENSHNIIYYGEADDFSFICFNARIDFALAIYPEIYGNKGIEAKL